jgi:hypothetical protein
VELVSNRGLIETLGEGDLLSGDTLLNLGIELHHL